MSEYLIYHGDFMTPVTEPGIVAFKATGNKILVRGSRSEITKWAEIIRQSTVLKETINNGEVSLQSWTFANKYASWTWFDEEDFDKYGDVYNNVKGSSVVVKIESANNDKK